MTTCTCGPCPVHPKRENRVAKDHVAPTPDETDTLRTMHRKKSTLLTAYMIDLYEGRTPGRTADQKASIRQIADALGVTYAAVYQRLSEHIKASK